MSRKRRIAWISGTLAALLLVVLGGAIVASSCVKRDVFERVASPDELREGDALARAMADKLGGPAWERIQYIHFDFEARAAGPRLASRSHDWDKFRGLARISQETGGDSLVVWVRLTDKTGVVHRNGVPVKDEAEIKRLLEKGFSWWTNDSYWLAAPFKVFDPGVRRAGYPEGVLISFDNGVGLTPGDRYLFRLAPDATLLGWDFILQSGMAASFDFESPVTVLGAVIHTVRKNALSSITFRNLRASISSVDDPFAPLLEASPSR
ncbi:MAG: hypothetical protein GMKNLPBB_00214 [Myxococcota bacterium]|nr:hypothetical protein [Myxococcota bacterium]